MREFHGHVTSVSRVTLGDETTADVAAGETTIPLYDAGDFAEEGGHVLIGEVTYGYTLTDDGEESGTPTIELDTGLAAAVEEFDPVYVWNPSTGATIATWEATVTDDSDSDGSSLVAVLSHALIDKFTDSESGDIRGLVGESVLARADEDSEEWTVVEVYGKAPETDPGFLATGSLGAETTIYAGDPDGKRVAMDGTGTPAFEAYDATNTQTVNIDGEVNYITGSIATAQDGSRVEIGEGIYPGGSLDINEVRIYTGSPNEDDPASVRAFYTTTLDKHIGHAQITTPRMGADNANDTAYIDLASESHDGTLPAAVTIVANETYFRVPPGLGAAIIHAIMGSGSVGTGTFRDSVDARVTALAQPLDATLTGLAALGAVVADRILYTTDTDTWAAATITAVARQLLAAATVADARTTLLVPALRKAVNAQTANYTVLSSDEDKVIQASGLTTITLPDDATLGTTAAIEFRVVRIGTSTISFAAGAGATVDSKVGAAPTIAVQYGEARVRRRAANRWIVTGDLA